jgi:hypothetical protein
VLGEGADQVDSQWHTDGYHSNPKHDASFLIGGIFA